MSDGAADAVGTDGRQSGDVGTNGGPDGRVDDADVAASDAFAALGSETRMGVVRTLFEAERDAGHPVARSFSALFEASDEETTAGFAYHLRQLPDTYVRKVDAVEGDADGGGSGTDEAGYRLTAAGRRVARALASGALTESTDRAPVHLTAPCPFCGATSLRAAGDDTVLTVSCGACEREVLGLPFPPAGYRAHDDETLPDAVDRYYRGRIATMRDGTCPECGGVVETSAELVDQGPSEESSAGAGGDSCGEESDAPAIARARMTCTACGYRLRCPVTLTVLREPAVVAAFHDAGIDLAARPLWNVGPEWRERVVSTDPLAVRVTAHLDDGHLACFVGRDLSVVHTERATPDDDDDDGRDRTPADGQVSGEDGNRTAAGETTPGEGTEPSETDADRPAVGEPDSATA